MIIRQKKREDADEDSVPSMEPVEGCDPDSQRESLAQEDPTGAKHNLHSAKRHAQPAEGGDTEPDQSSAA